MAKDTYNIMQALHINKAHIIGISLGGMIGQRFALMYPKHTQSVTCIMAAAGAPHPTEKIVNTISKPKTIDDIIQNRIDHVKELIGPIHTETDENIRVRVTRSILRNINAGKGSDCKHRQYEARMADDHRKYLLHNITIPTLILHGEADPRTPVSEAYALKNRINGSKLVTFPGMGHDLPAPLIKDITNEIISFIQLLD